MKISHLTLLVDSSSKAADFYIAAFGFRAAASTDKNLTELRTGNGLIAIAFSQDPTREGVRVRQNRVEGTPAECEIGIHVDDVRVAYSQALVCGGLSVTPPTLNNVQQTVAYIRDTNGVLIRLADKRPSSRKELDAKKKQLVDLESVGKKFHRELKNLGITTPDELAVWDPEELYLELQLFTKRHLDPVAWDMIAAAIHEAQTGQYRHWRMFTPQRLALMESRKSVLDEI